MEEILRVLPNETEDECLFRIGEAKRDGLLDLTWTQISDFLIKLLEKMILNIEPRALIVRSLKIILTLKICWSNLSLLKADLMNNIMS